ncbi:IS3 family transposase [Tannerella sp.]|uniref:IS3 family transposase n=1 Tax=Tannerella sp. TaxID=2382127 RepID=UPI003FA1F089
MRSADERKKMVDTNHETLSVSRQLNLVSIASSSFYYVPKGESEENLAILRLLDEQYFKTPFYGVLRLTALLVGLGYKVSHKRVRRLMQILDWKTIYREPKTTIGNKAHKKYPYLLRNLKIERCNQVWATDITFIPMKTGFMYLMAVIDLHSRYVLHWSLSNSMSAEWCAEVLKEAISKHGKPEIFNTDQGCQFTSDAFIKVLTDNEIKISMDGKERALDNVFIERLWRSVKYEHIYLNVYEDGVSLWKGLNRYFRFYNQERPHQSLSYKTPANCYYANAA